MGRSLPSRLGPRRLRPSRRHLHHVLHGSHQILSFHPLSLLRNSRQNHRPFHRLQFRPLDLSLQIRRRNRHFQFHRRKTPSSSFCKQQTTTLSKIHRLQNRRQRNRPRRRLWKYRQTNNPHSPPPPRSFPLRRPHSDQRPSHPPSHQQSHLRRPLYRSTQSHILQRKISVIFQQ